MRQSRPLVFAITSRTSSLWLQLSTSNPQSEAHQERPMFASL